MIITFCCNSLILFPHHALLENRLISQPFIHSIELTASDEITSMASSGQFNGVSEESLTVHEHVHNILLESLISFGLVGTIALVFLLGKIWGIALLRLRGANSPSTLPVFFYCDDTARARVCLRYILSYPFCRYDRYLVGVFTSKQP